MKAFEVYEPTDTEKVADLLIEEGSWDETGFEMGRRDEEDALIRSTEPPEDMIAYIQDLEDVG